MSLHPFQRGLLVLALALSSASQAAETTHVRGEIVSVTKTELVVREPDGQRRNIRLDERSSVFDVSPTNLEAIDENSYIGVAGVAASDGVVRAQGVLVFPEAARGQYEGAFPWDRRKGGSMTNATVSRRLVRRDGRTEIEVNYGKNKRLIQVDKSTVFGSFVPGTLALVVQGAQVLVLAEADAAGTGQRAGTVMVGRKGFKPPI